ncbi:helix-turn-helix domain-containing protein [Acerihabitans arboris]|uniref:Helix-turn-helix domain-containing protein n=1 Tax=Acerihabitans arboris TaxID=2691583 RepID=A0A845SHH0_9GAMM|nr:helix-turn-helix domain-containing protein [Acerihabitans arboris]NDL62832.1 helix-turn-helix domain-containing protein [Acerihabitans arboris]
MTKTAMLAVAAVAPVGDDNRAGAPTALPGRGQVRRIIILTYPGCFLGEIIKLLEMLAALNDFAVQHGGQKVQFVTQIYSSVGGRISSPASRMIHAETLTMRGPVPVETDLLIVAHGTRAAAAAPNPLLSRWLQAVCPGAKQIVALGSGALRMAAAGLLNHRQATTHSALAPYLAEHYPLVSVNVPAALQIDGNILTTSEHIDLRELALLLLKEPLPPNRPAQGGEQALQLDTTPVMARVFTRHDTISHRVTLWWLAHIDEDLSMDRSARFLAMSERSLRRHFTLEVGYSPYLFLLLLRLELARQALIDTDLPIDKIARRGGLHDGQQLARMFRKFFKITPHQYRTQPREARPSLDHPLYAALFNGRAIPPWLQELQCDAASHSGR